MSDIASVPPLGGPLSPGSLVGGRFLVEGGVREDALGTVLRAQDQKTQKPILLRVLREGLLDEAGLKRLREECRVAARLAHRNIAATYGVGSGFVASEWVDGHHLAEVLAKRVAEGRPMSLRGAYNVVAHVCRALTAAHARTCHGALRPEVVWVTSAGRVKVSDFGLGKALVESQGPNALPYAEQASLAPEVKAGEPPTARSDIFGVGAILYQLLTGKSPAEGFVPPSQAHPEATPAIDEILLRCLALDPAARFGSPDEVRSALQPLAAAAPEADAHDFDVDVDVDGDGVADEPAPKAAVASTTPSTAKPATPAPPAKPAAPRPPAPPPSGAKPRPPGPPPKPAAPGTPAAPQVGRRVGIDEEFRTSLPGPAPGAAAEVDLGGLLAKITENDAPRWMVVKDGLDHGPFSGRELVELIVKSEVLADHVLLNMDDGDRRPVKEHPELREFVDQARIRREEDARKAALKRAESAEKRTGVAKAAIAAGVLLVLGGGVAVFLMTREAGGNEQVAQADMGDLFQRGQIEVEGTAGILPDPPRGGGGMRRAGGGGGGRPGGFHGSYEDAMNVPIDLGDATGSGSQARLSPGDVASTMNRSLNSIYNACVVPELRRGGALGNVTIDIAIAGSGSVMGVSARAGSGEFKTCIRNQVSRVRFPSFAAPRMGARYSFSAG